MVIYPPYQGKLRNDIAGWRKVVQNVGIVPQ